MADPLPAGTCWPLDPNDQIFTATVYKRYNLRVETKEIVTRTSVCCRDPFDLNCSTTIVTEGQPRISTSNAPDFSFPLRFESDGNGAYNCTNLAAYTTAWNNFQNNLQQAVAAATREILVSNAIEVVPNCLPKIIGPPPDCIVTPAVDGQINTIIVRKNTATSVAVASGAGSSSARCVLN